MKTNTQKKSHKEVQTTSIDTPKDMIKRVFVVAELLEKGKSKLESANLRKQILFEKSHED